MLVKGVMSKRILFGRPVRMSGTILPPEQPRPTEGTLVFYRFTE